MTDQDWRKFSIEAVVIVVSILLAFSIEAWWDGLKQNEDEQVLLQSLLDDLNEKQRYFEANRLYNQAILEATTKLLQAVASKNLSMDSDELDETINGVVWTNQEYNWDSAPLDSLFGGSNISSISNPRLLQELAQMQTALNVLKITSRNDEEFYSGQLLPFLRKNISLTQLTNITNEMPGTGREINFPKFQVAERIDHSILLGNLEFENLLNQRIFSITDIVVQGYEGFEDRLNLILNMIETELSD